MAIVEDEVRNESEEENEIEVVVEEDDADQDSDDSDVSIQFPFPFVKRLPWNEKYNCKQSARSKYYLQVLNVNCLVNLIEIGNLVSILLSFWCL